MRWKRTVVLLLVLSLLLAMPTFAVESNTAGSTVTSDVVLTVGDTAPQIFSVIVPSEIPINITKEGVVTVASNLNIQNNSSAAVDVTGISVVGTNGWSVGNYAEDYSTKAIDTKEIAMSFRGDATTGEGVISLTPDNWSIQQAGNLPINAEVKLPKQSGGTSKTNIATVNWTFDWSQEQGGTGGHTSSITNDWVPGTLMLNGSSKAVNFNWSSTYTDEELVSVESSNQGVATVEPVQTRSAVSGSQAATVTGLSAGTTTITATLKNGEFTSFDVQVYEVQNGGNVDGTVNGGDGLEDGTDLGDGNHDITIDIPVTGPDGEDTITVTPEFPPDTVLKPGDNEIQVEVDVNGVKVIITIHITVESDNPSDGLIQTVENAQAMGFTFSPYGEGLQIDSFENKQFKSEINVPEQIGDFKVLKIGDNAFKGQTNISKITVPGTVTNIGTNAFEGCASLVSANIPDGVTSISDRTFSGCTSLASLNIPDTVTSIGWNAFSSCTSLESLSIPSSVTSIDPYAFSYCSGMVRLNIPSSVTYLGYQVFDGAGASGSVLEFNSPVIEENGSSEMEGTNFNSVILGDNIKSIGNSKFEDGTGIISVTIPDSVTEIGLYAFRRCTSLKSIVIPDSVTYISFQAFSYCKNLESVVLPNGTLYIRDETFSGCTSLRSVTIPSTVKSIDDSAFYECESLESITIPVGAEYIGDKAFYGCTGLTSVTIPDSVTEIGKSAFYKVPHVYYSGSASGSPWGALAIN